MARQDITRPSDIGERKHDLIEAVTNAYMAVRVPELTGLKYERGSCKDNEFRYTAKADGSIPGIDLEADPEFYCSYPGGHWQEHIPLAPDSDRSAGDSTAFGTEALPDAKAIYDLVESEVSSWLDPWTTTTPSPNEFTNQITSLANVAQQLYVGDQVVFGNGTGGASNDPAGASAVTDVRSALDNIANKLDDMEGALIDAFQNTYASDIEQTLGGQRGLATSAGLAIAAEAIVWNEALGTLDEFLNKATYDFNQLAGGRDGSGQDVQAVLGAVSAVSGLAGATVGLAFPPFAAAMGIVGGVAGVASLFFPAQAAVTPTLLVLDDADYTACWTSFKDGILAISDDLSSAEEAITRGCRAMLADYRTNPDNYSLTLKTRRGGQGPGDQLNVVIGARFEYDYAKLRSIAGCVESVGDHQRVLAGRLGGADAAGNPSALVSSEWQRGSLPTGGTIGYGSSGPYDAYAELVDETVDLLIMEQRTAHRIAENLIASVLDYQATDQRREAELDKIARRWDTLEVPEVNG